MPTTTNFGWTTPADTDLVKDGALAIRTLGNGIDTSLVDLKGGTTGQVLSKTSNTDMDFTWINNDQGDITAVTAGTGISGGGTSGAVTITNDMATTITASGDIIIGTGSGTYDNLPIGTTGQILTADTTVSPYKVKWATPAASASGLTYISGASFSAAASQSLDSVFSSTYQNYLIMFNLSDTSTSPGQITFRFRTSGTDNTNASYAYYNDYMAYGNTWSRVIDNASGQTAIKFNTLDTSNYALALWVFSPNETNKTNIQTPMTTFKYESSFYTGLSTSMFDATTAFDGFKFYTATDMTGTVKVYGLANS